MRKPMSVTVVIACAIALSSNGQLATGDPTQDSTAELQAEFDQLKPGEKLTLQPGTFRHSGIIYVRVPGVSINGNSATLQATNDLTSGIWIEADNVSLSNLILTSPPDGPRYYNTDQHKIVVGANGVKLSDITINGSASAGVYMAGSNFRIDRLTIRDTRADGIQITGGASNGQINDTTTERTGDDGFAIVSLTEQAAGRHIDPCRNIVINSPVVNGTTAGGRGILVQGGENIAIHNIKVAQTSLAGVFISSIGDPFFTQSTNGVEVSGGVVTNSNVEASAPMGAIAVSSEHAGYSVANATISNLTIVDTPPSARSDIAIEASNGGTLENVAFRNIQIRKGTDQPAFVTNAPSGGYTASGITVNGQAAILP